MTYSEVANWSLSDALRWTRANQVHDDWSLAKPREECIPFTFEISPSDDPRYAASRERAVKAIGRELNRKSKPKVDNLAAFLKIKFPVGR